MKKHICKRAYRKVHKRLYDAPNDVDIYTHGYGPAIDNEMFYCDKTDLWWIGNGEYASPIASCPYCGKKLKTKKEL